MRALLIILISAADACTTILVGREASADGSVFCSHTNDGTAKTDPRLVHVPARDHAPGVKRPVYASPEDYPRYVGAARGVDAYLPVDGQKPFEPIGYIDEVESTFAYFEDTYGALNEMGLGTGESTCSCVDWPALGGKDSEPCANATTTEGCALFSIDALNQVAMERASTAKEAVQLMGDLAVEHGFYGADSFEGSAESLMVVDPEEGWIFHVLAHPTAPSAIWAAERVPDDHVAVVANSFVIRRVDLTDAARFLGSDLAAVAAAYPELAATCPSNDDCDFTRTFGGGEYAHKYYSGRRMWGMFRQLAPEHALDPEYPTSQPQWIPYAAHYPAAGVTRQQILDAHRDHYEGTPYDLTAGLAAGPFGTPNRYDPGAGEEEVRGTWERAISIARTSDSFVVQARRSRSVLWWGAHVPHATVYVPFFASQEGVPATCLGRQGLYDPTTMLWAVRRIHTFMDLKFSYIVEDVRAFQHAMEAEGGNISDAAHATAADAADAALAHLETVHTGLGELLGTLFFKYADGWVNLPDLGTSVGYPAWWLKKVGYEDGPPAVCTALTPCDDPPGGSDASMTTSAAVALAIAAVAVVVA